MGIPGSFDHVELFLREPFDLNDVLTHEPSKKTFGQYFKFPAKIENIAEVDAVNYDFHGTERTIYDDATQLTNALAHFGRETSDIMAQITHESLIRQYKEAVRINNLGETRAEKEKQRQTRKDIAQELLPQLQHTIVHSWAPMLIVGKNNGLLRVIMDEERVKDFSDIRYGLYSSDLLEHLTSLNFEERQTEI